MSDASLPCGPTSHGTKPASRFIAGSRPLKGHSRMLAWAKNNLLGTAAGCVMRRNRNPANSVNTVRYMASTLRSMLVGVAAVTLVAGCAQGGSTTRRSTPEPTQPVPAVPLPDCRDIVIPSAIASPGLLITPPAAASTVTVTSADAGATVFLTTLQHLIVEIGFPGPPVWSGTPQGADVFWTLPAAPNPGPLYRSGSATCPGGSAAAVFTAVGTGGTTVDATTDSPCSHTNPACEMAQQGFEIYVVVRPPR